VLITGGSRGLGLEAARRWAAEGARVVLCARTAEDIERAVNELRSKGGSAYGFQCDVTSRQQVERLVATVIDRWGAIDVLVNNAGIIQVGPQSCMNLQDYRRALETHLWGPLYAIEAVLPHMRRRRRGRIVNVASIGGEISVPHLLPYSASKFALVGLSEGLAAELARDGIQVTTVCPGLMRTGSPRNAHFKGQHRKEYAWFSLGASLPLVSISAQRAAAQIVDACRRGDPYLAISLPAKAAVLLCGLFPGPFVRLMRLVNRLLPSPGGIGRARKAGDESFSGWSPSPLTILNEQAARRNNQLRQSASE
jgi:NAD(P)-dependent dehydrogenase (short-subunit alcohol dehydrogenase family)